LPVGVTVEAGDTILVASGARRSTLGAVNALTGTGITLGTFALRASEIDAGTGNAAGAFIATAPVTTAPTGAWGLTVGFAANFWQAGGHVYLIKGGFTVVETDTANTDTGTLTLDVDATAEADDILIHAVTGTDLAPTGDLVPAAGFTSANTINLASSNAFRHRAAFREDLQGASYNWTVPNAAAGITAGVAVILRPSV
jgi:hypothetical protein